MKRQAFWGTLGNSCWSPAEGLTLECKDWIGPQSKRVSCACWADCSVPGPGRGFLPPTCISKAEVLVLDPIPFCIYVRVRVHACVCVAV